MFSSPHYPNRMDGIKTISSHQCPHLSETGSSPSPPSPPATFRCLQSTTLVHSVHSIPCPVEIDTVCETGKPLEFNVTKRVFFFSLQLPAPRRLLHCWASESIETPSEIIREHSQLCNFLITKETTVFIKNSIQVHTWKPLGVTLLKNLIWLTHTICTRLHAVTHLLLFGALSVLSFVTLQADSVASLLSLPRRSSLIISTNPCQPHHSQLNSDRFRAVFVLQLVCTALKWTNQPGVDTPQWCHC